MKLLSKIILTVIVLLISFLQVLFVVYGAPADYFVRDTIDVSSNLTNPQAIEVIPGGFIIIDWKSDASTFGYILDGQGNLLDGYNLSAEILIGQRITSIRTYTTANSQVNYIILDDSNKTIYLLNASSLSYDNQTFSTNATFGAADTLVGICTDKSSTWVAVGNRDVVNKLAGVNGTVNQSGEYAIPGTNNAGGFDCFDGDNKPTIILDDTTGIVYITKNATHVDDYVNISDLTSQGLNTFSDIALATDPNLHRPDFYALNNATNLIYHIMKRPPSVLNVFDPDILLSNPVNQKSFNSRFSSVLVQFNFSAEQPNSSASQFNLASDLINCTVFVNNTANSSMTNTPNNVSIVNFINVTFPIGTFKTDVRCLANVTYAKQGISDFRIITVSTYKHIIWMGENFSVYYDSDAQAFKAALGFNQTELSADFNITTDEPVAIRIVWNNVTGNRSIYINGELKASDTYYGWSMERLDKIYFLSRNDTGQANAVLSYVQTSLDSTGSSYSVSTFIDSWKTTFKNLVDSFTTSSYFYQFKAILRRGLSSEKPILRFINISFDDTLMNFSIEPDVNFLDFSFSSGTDDVLPVGQTDSVSIFRIVNIGNKSFDLQAASLTPFNSCFTVSLFNQSGGGYRAGLANNTINLSTTYQRIGNLASSETADVWLNVSASGCTANSEFFDIDFITSP